MRIAGPHLVEDLVARSLTQAVHRGTARVDRRPCPRASLRRPFLEGSLMNQTALSRSSLGVPDQTPQAIAPAHGMSLTIVAATGGIGRQLLEQGLAAGHDVTAIVRHPEHLSRNVRHLMADLGEACAECLETAVAGTDAVLSGLGARSAPQAGVARRG